MKNSILSILKENIISDTISEDRKTGNYIARKEFFYTHGKTAKDFENNIKKEFPIISDNQKLDIEIVNSREIWKTFKGGASTRNQSHWCVEFKIKIL